MFAGTGTPSPPGIYRSTDAGKTWQPARRRHRPGLPERGHPAAHGHRDRSDRSPPRVGGPRGGRRPAQRRRRRDVDQGERPDPEPGRAQRPRRGGAAQDRVHRGQRRRVAQHRRRRARGSRRARARCSRWHYPRGIAVKPDDPQTVYVTLGDSTPGRIGTVMRSRDAGATWQSLDLPVPAELRGVDGEPSPRPRPTWCSRPAATAISTGATTAATPGASSGASSARCPRSCGCRAHEGRAARVGCGHARQSRRRGARALRRSGLPPAARRAGTRTGRRRER